MDNQQQEEQTTQEQTWRPTWSNLSLGTLGAFTTIGFEAAHNPGLALLSGVLSAVATWKGDEVINFAESLASPEGRASLAAKLSRKPHAITQPKDARVIEDDPQYDANATTEVLLDVPTLKEVQTENGVISLPVAPAFKDMCHLLSKEKLVLCYSVDGPVYGTIEDLLSMAIVGKPGRGKTVSLMYYVAMLLKSGAEVFVWDPHGVMGELAILNNRALTNMPATAKVTYLDRKEEIIDSVPVLQQKLVERDEEYRRDKRAGRNFVKGVWQKHPLLLLADELPVIAMYEDENEKKYKQMNKQRSKDDEEPLDFPSMTFLVQRFVLEARKWRCFFIGSGQSTDAQVLPTRVVENMSSRIVFFSSDRRARMAGLEQEAIKEYLPVIRRAGPGTMIFDCSRLDEPIVGAIPEMDVADLRQFLAMESSQAPDQITIPVENGQTLTVTYADFMAFVNSQNHQSLVSQTVSNVSALPNGENDSENTVETASQANPDKVVTGVFPVSKQEPETPDLSLERDVPEWKWKQIQAMKEAGYADRDIAALVKLTGRKYRLYQEVVRRLGYAAKEA